MRRRSVVAVLAVSAVAAGGAIAWAAIPDASGVIHACFKKSGGALRVIDSGVAACKPDESHLDWNQVGQQGLAGPPGEQGLPGISGYEVARARSPVDSVASKAVTASCPEGKHVIGGGGIVIPNNAPVALTVSTPVLGPPPADSWFVGAVELGELGYADSWELRATAICADVGP
jgi:hypothetical protein